LQLLLNAVRALKLVGKHVKRHRQAMVQNGACARLSVAIRKCGLTVITARIMTSKAHNIETNLIEVGRWLETAPLSITFSIQDRIAGFAALEILRNASTQNEASCDALSHLEKLVNTAQAQTEIPIQALVLLQDLVHHRT
jgi:hypothetical protein